MCVCTEEKRVRICCTPIFSLIHRLRLLAAVAPRRRLLNLFRFSLRSAHWTSSAASEPKYCCDKPQVSPPRPKWYAQAMPPRTVMILRTYWPDSYLVCRDRNSQHIRSERYPSLHQKAVYLLSDCPHGSVYPSSPSITLAVLAPAWHVFPCRSRTLVGSCCPAGSSRLRLDPCLKVSKAVAAIAPINTPDAVSGWHRHEYVQATC